MGAIAMLRFANDAWRAERGGADGIAARQRRRLADLVAYARQHSRFYAQKYRHVLDPVATNPAALRCGRWPNSG